MKIESVRGWLNAEEFRDIPRQEGPYSNVPVLVIPLTPENIEEMREKASSILASRGLSNWRLAGRILTALGVTEESDNGS